MRRKGRVIRNVIEVTKNGKTIKLVVYKKATNSRPANGSRSKKG